MAAAQSSSCSQQLSSMVIVLGSHIIGHGSVQLASVQYDKRRAVIRAASLTAFVQRQLMVSHRFSFGELGPRLSKSILEYVILTWSSFLPYKSDGVVYFNTVDEPPARPRAAAAGLVALFAFDDMLLSKLLRYDPGRVEHIACHNYAASSAAVHAACCCCPALVCSHSTLT